MFDRLLGRDDVAEHTEQCDDCTRSLSRRALLGGLFGGGVALMTSGGLSMQAAFAEPGYTGDTIIVLSLRGGIDGLSVVAPIGDPGYAAARPSTALGAEAIPLDGMFGLHPALGALKPLWDGGQFAAVHAVGSMDQTRSHFAAMEQIENAAPGSHERTGWLDRVMTARGQAEPFQSSTVGQATAPLMTEGAFPQMVVSKLADTRLKVASDQAALDRWARAATALHDNTNSRFGGAVHRALAASQTTLTMTASPSAVSYPDTGLGGALSDVATMIKADVGLQVATVDQGAWDHHSNARERMSKGLTDLAAALSAFVADLGPLWKSVTVVTISEFGRRVHENGSAGFDHGHGNVMLLASGSGLSAGRVFGQWPGLADEQLRGGEDLAGTTDYRSVLSELFAKRGGLSNTQAASAFPDFSPTPVGAFV